MFVILQDSRNRVDFAPANWIKGNDDGSEIIFWPKKDVTVLQSDPNSEPVTSGPDKWHVVYDKVKRRDIATVEDANVELEKMQYCVTEESDADDGRRKTRIGTKSVTKIKSTKSTVVPTFKIDLSRKLNSAIASDQQIVTTVSPKSVHNRRPDDDDRTSFHSQLQINTTPVSSRSSTPMFTQNINSPGLTNLLSSTSLLMQNTTFNSMGISQGELDAAESAMKETSNAGNMTNASTASTYSIDEQGNHVYLFPQADGVRFSSFSAFS